MIRNLVLVLIVLAFALSAAAPALAQAGAPVGACPRGFTLHPFAGHENHHEHHIGLAQDTNKNTYTCVMHLGSGLHVHVDDVVR